jgi:hypothetical protein
MLFLMSLLATSQSTGEIVLGEDNYNNWYQCEQSGRGLASFYVGVSFTGEMENDGYYYYDVFFYNNSFYKNGKESSTYIQNLKYYVWYKGEWVLVFTQDYALIKPKTENYNGFYHAIFVYNFAKIKKIKITWGDTSIY